MLVALTLSFSVTLLPLIVVEATANPVGRLMALIVIDFGGVP